MLSYPAEIAAMTTMGAAMEGAVPEPQDFLDAAILIGGLKASGVVSSRLRTGYAEKGEHPYGVLGRMKENPKLQEEFLSSNFDKVKKPIAKEAKEVEKIEPKTAEERVLATISTKEGKKKINPSETLHDLYTNAVDDLHPLNRVVQEMTKGEKVEVSKDPYKLARLFRGVKGVADHFLEHSPFKFNKKANIGKPLSAILNPYKNDLNGVRAFVKSKRVLELQKRGIETGVDVKDAREVIKNGEGKYGKVFEEIQEYQTHVLTYLRDSGLMSRQTFEKIKELNKDYAPFYRVMEDTKTRGAGKGLEVYDPIKRIKGSDLNTIDPLESIIKNTYLFTTLAEKNRIGTSLVKLAAARKGLGKYVKHIKKPIRPVKVTKEELTGVVDKYTKILKSSKKKTTEKVTTTSEGTQERAVSKVEGRVLEALQSRGWSEGESIQIISRLKGAKDVQETKTIIRETIEKETERFSIDIPDEGLTIFRPTAFSPKENQLRVWINGKDQLFEVHPDIARVFKGLDSESLGLFTKIMSVPAKLLRAGAILSPEFIARNPIRDTLSAFVFSKWGFTPGVDFIRGIASVVKKDEFYKDWQKSGGTMSELTSLDRKYLQKGLGEVVSKTPVLNRIKYGANPIELLRVLSELSEQGTRVGEFKKARKKGASLEEAGFASREVTLDFARIGAKTRAVNSMVAFWNANVQGTDKLVRSFKDSPMATTAKVAAGITLPSVLLAAANHNDGRWDDIPRWQKDLFWIVMPGHVSKEKWAAMSSEEQATFMEDNHIWRIPKPFELGIIFGTIPERFTEALLEKNPEVLDGILESVGRGAAPGVLPTISIPIIENWANRSLFLDRPLIPATKEGLLPEYQYKAYTTEAAKAIGKLLGKLPPLKENPNIAPVKIENIIRGWSGGLGMNIVQLASWGFEKTGILPTPTRPDSSLSDLSVIKAFHVRYPAAGSENINKFYDQYFSSKKRLDTFMYLAKKELNPSEAAKVIAGHESDMVKLDSIYDALSKCHQAINLIHNHPDMSGTEKRQLIDKIYLDMSKMATAGNQALKQIKKDIKQNKGELQ